MRLLPEPYESMRRDAGVGDLRLVAALACVWAVPGLLGTTETIAFWKMSAQEHPAWRAFAYQMPQWFAYATLTGPILWFGERLPLVGRGWLRRVAAHLGLAVLCGSVYAVTAAVATGAFSPVPSSFGLGQMVLSWYLSALPLVLLAYFGVLGAGRAVYWFSRHRNAEVAGARLEAQLAEARLSALRMQLNPHFLFNSLNAMTVLIRDSDSAAAERAVHLLSELLRESLQDDGPDLVPLRQEIDFTLKYLEMERLRFPDRLDVHCDVPQKVGSALVPVLILQPLVENALRHGIAPQAAGGTVTIRAERRGDQLLVTVEDDGRGLTDGDLRRRGYIEESKPDGDSVRGSQSDGGLGSESGPESRIQSGVGLRNVRERLSILYGGDASCTLAPGENGGAVARLTLPLSQGGDTTDASEA